MAAPPPRRPSAAPATGTGPDPRAPADDPTLWLPAPVSRLPPAAPSRSGRRSVPPAAPLAPTPVEPGADEVGHRIGPNDHELFVSCEASVALHQQFEQKQPAYIAWHDVGPAGSRRLLAGVAAAGRRALQRLSVRRRGHGDVLATLEFLELPTADDRPLRLYTTDVDAPASDREAVIRTLLAHARLTVLMLAGPALRDPAAALEPLSAWMSRPPWPGRHLLLLPLGTGLRLGAAAQDLAVRHAVEVVPTPAAHRPSEAWQFVQSAWARLAAHGTLVAPRAPPGAFDDVDGPPEGASAGPGLDDDDDRAGTLRLPPHPSSVPAEPFPGFRTPSPPSAGAGPITAAAGFRASRAPGDDSLLPVDGGDDALPDTEPADWIPPRGSRVSAPARTAPTDEDGESASRVARLLRAAGNLSGFVAACVFELDSGRAVAHLGHRPDPQSLARHAAALMTAFGDASRGLGFGTAQPEALLTVGDRHLVIRPVAGEANLGLHLIVDRHATDLARLRSALIRLDALQAGRTRF